jgi:hypothetical protein
MCNLEDVLDEDDYEVYVGESNISSDGGIDTFK